MHGSKPLSMPIETVRVLQKGTLITMLEETSGAGADSEEYSYPIGTMAEVSQVASLPFPQGLSVTVIIGPQDGEQAIVNVFDEEDGCFPFAFASISPVVAQTSDGPSLPTQDIEVCGWVIAVVKRENGNIYMYAIDPDGSGNGPSGEIHPVAAAVLGRLLAQESIAGLERLALMIAPQLGQGRSATQKG